MREDADKLMREEIDRIDRREILEVRINKDEHTLCFVTHIYRKVPRWIAKRRWLNLNNPVTRRRLGLSKKKEEIK